MITSQSTNGDDTIWFMFYFDDNDNHTQYRGGSYNKCTIFNVINATRRITNFLISDGLRPKEITTVLDLLKVRWVEKHLGDIDCTITRDKGLVYGKILVDDYSGYIKDWLDFRPRGLVIMPANDYNKALRAWFVAFGVGLPVVYISSEDARDYLVSLQEYKFVIICFVIAMCLQILIAFLNKYIS